MDKKIDALEQHIALLTKRLAEAKEAVSSWTDANASLSRNAAEARAKNQGAGRGVIGAFLGAKYRNIVRQGAAASNAAISKEVAEKKKKISEGKQAAQNSVRAIQNALSEAKAQLSALKKSQKEPSNKFSADKKLGVLKKLKQALDDGLLTQEEYEEKRKKLVSEI